MSSPVATNVGMEMAELPEQCALRLGIAWLAFLKPAFYPGKGASKAFCAAILTKDPCCLRGCVGPTPLSNGLSRISTIY